MQRLPEIFTAPRLVFAARVVGALSAVSNLMLAVLCLVLLVRGDWLGLALGIMLLLPVAAWFVALRSPLTGAKVFAATFVAVWAIWTGNEMLPCDMGQCNLSGFLVVALPNLSSASTLSLLLCAGLFYAAHRIQSRPGPQQLSSF